jgi:uncharacterized membrane protein YfcA
MKDRSLSHRPALSELITVAVAGTVSGFLGTGGGAVMIILSSLISGKTDRRDLESTVLLCTCFSLVSAVGYMKSSAVPTELLYLLIPASVGGSVGALLSGRLPISWLKGCFGAVSVMGGLLILLK